MIETLLGFVFYALLMRQRAATLLRAKTQELDRANCALSDENAQRRHAEAALFSAEEQADVIL